MLEFFKTKTIKDSAVVTGGMGVSTLLSAAGIFLLARWLGPSGFGLYVSSLAIAVILTDSLELAISGSIVNFGSKNDRSGQQSIKFGFYLKLIVGMGLGLILALVNRPLASWINPALQQPLLLVALIIPTVFLQRFPRSVLQSQKRFLADISLEVVASLGRFLGVLGLYFSGTLTVMTGLYAYLGGWILAIIIGSCLISWKFLAVKIDAEVRRSFFQFQKWLTMGFILAAVHGRIDTTILLKLAGSTATGIYQAGFRFFMPVMQLASAMSLVFAPRFASFATTAEAKTYLSKAVKLCVLLSAGVLVLIPLAPYVINLIFGAEYQTAVRPMQILALGFIWFILAAPFTAYLIYAKKQTQFFALINLVQLVLLVGFDLWLIPRFGAIGAAWAMTFVLTVVNLIIVIKALK